ncbi:MAG: hypothetical protein HY655_05960, partial [Acidobacteria bacterium]|nr:hypothetical protein [Acidobacteriota bacterium]
MRMCLLGCFVALLLAAQGPVAAQTAPRGTPEAGKAVWALGNTSCRNCHGGDGEGAFGPGLAGRIDL